MKGQARDTKSEDESLAAFGLFYDGERPDTSVPVYPDNILTVRLFLSVSTQWRVVQGGYVGLDYSVLPFVSQTIGVTIDAEMFDAIRAMESAALEAMRD